jgi:DNA-binding MarR family transcriptional regulator
MADKQSIADIADHLGYWLRVVSNQVSTAFARKLAGEEVTVAEWVVLRILFESNGVAPNKLATILGMTRGAISKLADRLIAKRLIERTESRDDGRMHSLALTSKGKRLVPRLAALADENDRYFFDALDANERSLLRAVLEKLVGRHGFKEVPLD